VTHVIVTGGAGYIGSHAAFRLLTYSYPVQLLKRWKLCQLQYQNQNHNIHNLQHQYTILQNISYNSQRNFYSTSNSIDTTMHWTPIFFFFFCFKRTQTSLKMLLKRTKILLLMFQKYLKKV
jgi:UDP-glucose 4-epimerase